MADRRITELTELTSVADGDKLVVVDVSDTTGSASGTSKYTEAVNIRIPGGWVNVKQHGATGDGVTDDRAAIILAVAALSSGGTLYFPPGTYLISKYIYLNLLDGIKVCGTKGAIIRYPSSDQTVVDDATTYSDNQARCAFFIETCNDIVFEGLTFYGDGETADGTQDDITKNTGAALYFRECERPVVFNCHNKYGAALFQSDNVEGSDFGMRILACSSYGQRGNNRTGYEARVTDCHFELPDSTSWDRVGNVGSSHCVYLSAGKDNITISGNVFKNFRTNGIKISGTSVVVDCITITDNQFIECGTAIEIGTDSAADEQHASFIIKGNTFYDCATQRENWGGDGGAVSILGCKNCTVEGNHFYYTRHAVYNVAAISGISASGGYDDTGPPLENLTVINNHFNAATGLTPSLILTKPININRVGYNGPTAHPGCAQVAYNNINSVGSGIFVTKCMAPLIADNHLYGMSTAIQLGGNRFPVVHGNVQHTASGTSSNAQIRMNKDSFPVIYDNFATGRFELGGGKSMSINDNNNGSAIVDFPLRGVAGRAVPTQGYSELVVAFGDDWVDGDTISVNGVTSTYRDATPGANEFTTPAELIALLDAQASMNCVDYGNPWSITTNHLKISFAAQGGGTFVVDRTVTNPTAFVTLKNDTGADPARAISRGGSTAPGNLTVIWSQMVENHSVATLMAEESTGATLLATNGYFEDNKSTDDAGCVLMLNHGNVAGTEEFRWSLR